MIEAKVFYSMPPHLSYRVRIPLSIMLSSLLTAVALGLVISFETYRNIVQDKVAEGTRLTHALSPVLTQTLKHDDVWLAYSLLRGPEKKVAEQHDQTVMVLIDQNKHVFASNVPKKYRTGAQTSSFPSPIKNIVNKLSDETTASFTQFKIDDQLVLASKLYSENTYRGTLLIFLPSETFWKRFFEIMRSSFWVFLITLIPLTLIGWYWGHHMVSPLVALRDCMIKMREGNNMEKLACDLYEGPDEFGELSKQFKIMLGGLQEKKILEKEIIAQERLAAIGQLTASVAHEINNPVGGMLVALDTWKQHPEKKQDINKLHNLMERGLNQIKETVSALLVESRSDLRKLTPSDIADIHTLTETYSLPKNSQMAWSSDIKQPINLPATAIRQILMNLVVNAIQAISDSEKNDEVEVIISLQKQNLKIDVSNSGATISEEMIPHLFEPFTTNRKKGTGLGLWITYQLVKQLGGQIDVSSEANLTHFSVSIPIENQQNTQDKKATDQEFLSL
jgi:signal transduction histidine kinase